ncbi:MAG: serine/threonine-protein phosphatase [Candidatus Omnitrophica bacterium]|nr:serine/threonine-protein phosphatase [Candidatus Omnitrophota bacterium]
MGLFNKEILDQYLSEFLRQQSLLVKKRVRLLCLLTIVLYTCISLVGLFLFPEEFNLSEIPVWIILVLGSALIIYLNFKAKSLKIVKLAAYLFVIFFLLILTKINLIYYQYLDTAASLYLLVLFFICFVIPWNSLEVIFIAMLHFFAYSYLAFYAKNYIPQSEILRSYWFFDGLLLLAVGFILCFVIRRKETQREVENFNLLKEVEDKNAQMEKELELATKVHARLIPHSINTEKAQIAATYIPAYYMGGDYGRFNFSSKNKLTFIICDVTGHGVSAALLVNALHREFEKLVKEDKEPGLILAELDNFIRQDFAHTNMYLSAFCGQLNYKSMNFIYSNYGHPPQYIYKKADSKIERIASQTGWLGLPVKDKNIYQNQMLFNKGDQILLFTDGVVEAKSKAGQFYGSQRLEEFLRKNESLDPEIFNQQLLFDINSFTNNNLEDDIFIFNILIK